MEGKISELIDNGISIPTVMAWTLLAKRNISHIYILENVTFRNSIADSQGIL
jgi:hypothetical protein